MARIYIELLLYTFYLMNSRAMMMRNNALISKMVSNFQKDNTMLTETGPREPDQGIRRPEQAKNVLSIMQGVLCRNFPTIPCGIIVEDETLKTLIERSIQQLKYKQLSMDRTTIPPGYHLTLFPTVNSEDLSNFLQVSDTGYYSKDNKDTRTRKHRKRLVRNNEEEKEVKKRSSKKRDALRTSIFNGSKKIRKFYPHKVKYKDKQNKARDNYKDYSEEKLSMSVETPEQNTARKRITSNYNVDPADPPVWRIDYMKHGEPSLNMFGYQQDSLNEKLLKTGPNVIVGESAMEQLPRKDVLHTDVYIKKNFIRKNGLDLSSDPID